MRYIDTKITGNFFRSYTGTFWQCSGRGCTPSNCFPSYYSLQHLNYWHFQWPRADFNPPQRPPLPPSPLCPTCITLNLVHCAQPNQSTVFIGYYTLGNHPCQIYHSSKQSTESTFHPHKIAIAQWQLQYQILENPILKEKCVQFSDAYWGIQTAKIYI